MNTRLTRAATAALAATVGSLIGIAAAPSAYAANSGPVTCRSNTHPAYWLNGVRSDACDGPSNGLFVGEAEALTDGNPAYTSHGPLGRCQVQLNQIIGGVAVPIPAHTNTGVTHDNGLSCDVYDTWALPAGQYNVTTSYTFNGVWNTTVQGPVVNWPGA